MDRREEVNRLAREHVERLKRRLADGKHELARQRESVSETREHLTGMSRWIAQTELHLGEERARRNADGENSADS